MSHPLVLALFSLLVTHAALADPALTASQSGGPVVGEREPSWGDACREAAIDTVRLWGDSDVAAVAPAPPSKPRFELWGGARASAEAAAAGEARPALAPARPPAPRAAVDLTLAQQSAKTFPRITLLRFLENTALAATRVVRPEFTDVFVIVPAMAGTAVALNTDVETHRAINRLPDPVIAGQQLSYWVSYLGEGWVDFAIFAVLGLVGSRNESRAAIAGAQALAAVAVVSRLGKWMIRSERPSLDPDHPHFFSDRVMQADAMPSGHTMTAFATAAVLAKEYPMGAPVFYLLATWVALARVQQSTHWVSDTVVGAALGLLIGWESWRVTRAFELEVEPWVGGAGAGIQLARTF
jgi:membrane-associated phospholipid phosphatase